MAFSPLSPSTLRLCLWTICSVGVILNVLVFRKYRSTKCRQSNAVRSSLQLLCVMAAADTLSLLALMLALGSQHLGTRHVSTLMVAAVCKLDLFLIHASSAFGIWCWLILSGLRYLAIHHPYTHFRLHREPLFLLICVAIGCCLLETWILFDVTYLEEAKTCGETLPEKLGTMLQLAEILWTYFLPLSLVIILDLKVLCCQYTWPKRMEDVPRNSATTDSALDNASCRAEVPVSPSPLIPIINCKSHPQSRSSYSMIPSGQKTLTACHSSMRCRRKAAQLSILKRCLCISVIDLGMNLPNYVVRLYLTLASEEMLQTASHNGTFLWLQDLSQLLYFAQFSMNALYLVAINYVLPTTALRQKRAAKTSANLVATISAQQNNYSITPRNQKRRSDLI